MTLRPGNRLPEDVVVKAVIIAELKLSDVQRQIFLADLMIAAHNSAFEDAPKTFNRLSVDCTNNVLAFPVIDDAMRVFVTKFAIAGIGVSAKKADLCGHRIADKIFKRNSTNMVDDAGNDIALALNGSNNRNFTGSNPAAAVTDAALVLMAVFPFAADESFVNLDDAAEFGFRFNESGADFMRHVQRSFIRAKAHDALDLKAGNSLLAGQHQVNDAEPLAEGFVRVLEDRPGSVRETVAGRTARSALRALPVVAGSERIDLQIATARTMNALRPAAGDQIGDAGFLVGELRLELGDGHLVNGLRTLGHSGSPCRWEDIALNPVLCQEADNRPDMHLPDQPAAVNMDERDWAMRHIGSMRRVAVDALKPRQIITKDEIMAVHDQTISMLKEQR